MRKRIRDFAPSLLTNLGSLELWQAIGWVAVLTIAMALGLLATEIVMHVSLRLFGSRDANADRRSFRYVFWGAIGFSIYKLIIPAVGLSDEAKQVIGAA